MAEGTDKKKLIIRIAEIVIFELKLQDITPETFDSELDLVDELGVDSMDLTTVALVLQDEYSISIDEDDYPKLRSIRMIAEYIEQKLIE
jgi:acyl carrier protein